MTYGDGFLEDFVNLWDFDYQSEATSNGTTTTTVDTARTEADDTWNGNYIKFLSGANAGVHRKITDFDAATDTFTHVAFTNATADGDKYVISKHWGWASFLDPADSFVETEPDDILKMTVVCDDAVNEETAYIVVDISPNLDTDVYKKLTIRHKETSAALNIRLQINGGAGAIVYLDSSQEWKTETIDLKTVLSGADLTFIHLGFNNAVGEAAGTFYGYCDFVKVHKDVFTIPHVGTIDNSGGLFPKFTADIQKTVVPGRGTPEKHKRGIKDVTIRLEGDMLAGENWGNTIFGEQFLEILQSDAWSWFTSDAGCFKVIVSSFEPKMDTSSAAVYKWVLELEVYSASSMNEDTWGGVYGWLGVPP